MREVTADFTVDQCQNPFFCIRKETAEQHGRGYLRFRMTVFPVIIVTLFDDTYPFCKATSLEYKLF